MNSVVLIRVSVLYLPIIVALIAGLALGKRPRLFAACLLSVLWTATTLPWLQQLNAWAGWWTYAPDVVFCGIPLELYLGWIVLWGILPQLALRRLGIGLCLAILAAIDVATMPLLEPVLQLGPRWLIGEAIGVAIVLLPSLCFARWTLEGSHLPARATTQLMLAGLLFLYLLPEIVFALRPGREWADLAAMPSWERQLGIQLLAILALPGVSAVMEFVERGDGTPIPYDPPHRLVSSGIYRYCANPMQASCALVMISWSALLGNLWLLAVAAVSIVYSTGIAHWDESRDLEERFGQAYSNYRKKVRNWFPRWRPYHEGAQARLYVAATCGPCTELRRWFESRRPLGMILCDAEALPAGSIRRLRYDPCDGCNPQEGVRAFGRALEHLNLGWALAGCALRLPVVWQFVQLVMDAGGFGPRTLEVPVACETSSTGRETAARRPLAE